MTPFDPATTPVTALTNALVQPGTGLNLVNATFDGAASQAGTYSQFALSDGTTSLSLPAGILLTSGDATLAPGPNDQTGAGADLARDGDPDLTALVGEQTYDAMNLTVQFTADPGTSSVFFDFAFGSEEFPEWVGQFNDAFAAYLDGQQIAYDQATPPNPVTVNNNYFLLNNSGDTTDPNTVGKTVVNFNIQYDGLTPRLTTQAPLDPGVSVHTLKFTISDTRDHILDSGVFLTSLRGVARAVPPGTEPNSAPHAAPDAYTVPEGQTLVVTEPGVLGNDSDEQEQELTAVLDAGPAHGTLTLHADGSFAYVPAFGFTGTDQFTYRASDGDRMSDPATVSILVTPSAAHFSLILDDPTTPGVDVVIADNGAAGTPMAGGSSTHADQSMTPGMILYMGPVGNVGSVIAVAASAPVMPNQLFLSVNVFGSGPGALLAQTTQTGFQGVEGLNTVLAPIGGVTNGAVTFTEQVTLTGDPTQGELENPAPITPGPFGSGVFSTVGQIVFELEEPGTFSLTKTLWIEQPAGGHTGVSAYGIDSTSAPGQRPPGPADLAFRLTSDPSGPRYGTGESSRKPEERRGDVPGLTSDGMRDGSVADARARISEPAARYGKKESEGAPSAKDVADAVFADLGGGIDEV